MSRKYSPGQVVEFAICGIVSALHKNYLYMAPAQYYHLQPVGKARLEAKKYTGLEF